MRIAPFYSPLRGIGLVEAWHDRQECPIGQSIAPHDRVAGRHPTQGRCVYCALLDLPLSGQRPGSG